MVYRGNPPLSEEILLSLVKRKKNGCLEWLGPTLPTGYAVYKTGGKTIYVYRWVYEFYVGRIPKGMTIDHTCHDWSKCKRRSDCAHRRCVEVTHLEPATQAKNALRGGSPLALNSKKTHCLRGHPLSGENLYINPRGGRECRTCRREYMAQYYLDHKEIN